MLSATLQGLYLILSFSLASPSYSQQEFTGKIIRRIEFRGLKRISAASLLFSLGEEVRIGQPFDPIAISKVTGKLYLTGHFSWVEDPIPVAFEDGIKIIFTLREKPAIGAIQFIAEDTSTRKPSIGRKKLKENISTRAKGYLSSFELQTDVQQILQTYHEKGYLFAEVSQLVRHRENDVHVIFLIKEGPRVRISEVSFVGNKTVKSSTLNSLIATKKKDWFFGFFNPGYYNREELTRDIDKIKQYYQGLGFFEVLVAVDNIEHYDQNRRIKIRIFIEEGPRYIFTGYTFEGNTVFDTPTLLGLTQTLPGRFFSNERMRKDREEVLNYYKDRAYIFAKVEAEFRFRDRGTTVEINFKIEEDHEIHIDLVHIRGNVKTQDRVIRRELEFYPGEKVNWQKQQKSRSNLARLQFFRSIDYDYSQGSAPNHRDLLVKVDEEATGRLLIGFGVTSGFGVIGNFSITKSNFDLTDTPSSIYDIPDSFSGAGQTLNITLQPGTQRSRYSISFTEPYLFDTRNSLTLAASSIQLIRDDYDENRVSFTPSIGHALDFDRDLVFSIGTRVEQVEIKDIDFDADPDVFEVEGFTTIIAASTRLDYNKVLFEPLEGPYDGHHEWLSFEYAGEPLGGEVDFNKLEGALELYYPIYVHEESRLHHVISLFNKFGGMEGSNQTNDIPIFERFFLGGPHNVRGFRFRGLGPHSTSKEALGGTAVWFGNLEYVFPIFQKFLRGVVFLDYGNLAVEPSVFDLEEMRYAAGVGVRVNFPFLGQPIPIGLYYGKAFKKESSDRTRSFLFTIGTPF